MNDSATLADIIGPIIVLGLTYALYKLLYGQPQPRGPRYQASLTRGGVGRERSDLPTSWGTELPHTPHTPHPQQRTVIAVLDNPHPHPYDNLTLDQLHDHLFNEHFEVFNMTCQKDAAPERWRREHALDHGMVLR